MENYKVKIVIFPRFEWLSSSLSSFDCSSCFSIIARTKLFVPLWILLAEFASQRRMRCGCNVGCFVTVDSLQWLSDTRDYFCLLFHTRLIFSPVPTSSSFPPPIQCDDAVFSSPLLLRLADSMMKNMNMRRQRHNTTRTIPCHRETNWNSQRTMRPHRRHTITMSSRR